MAKYLLTKRDIEELYSVIKIGSSIEEHYNELAKYEIEGKKDTREYNSCIERLKSTLKLEKALFEKLTTSTEKVLAYVEYMIQNFGGGYTLGKPFFEIISNRNYFQIKEVRIYKKLTDYLDRHFIGYLSSEIFKPIITELDPSFINSVTTQMSSIHNIHEALINEQLLFVLSKLQKEIESPYSSKERNELVNAKFRLIFIDSYIEKTMIENNFKVSDEIQFWLNFIARMNGLTEKELEHLKESIAIKEIFDEISNIMTHKDSDYESTSLLIELKIRKIIIRGLLQILTDSQVMASNDAFHDLIESHNLDNGEHNLGIKAISEAYKQYNIDKKSIVTFSLIKK